ncbi:MAG: shikimate kinase [Actinobacteria bacterium]|nr:shikimate kinase [Actinomycetota bacterium]
MAPAVVLIGAPGAGKSTVGALIAQSLGVAHVDTDSMVEQRLGSTVADIFIELGEPAFRAAERDAVAEALTMDDIVVSLGGGAVMDPATQAALGGHAVVWLQVGLPSAATRVGMNQSRPLLLQNPRATLAKLLDERTAIYQSLAGLTVSTDDIDAGEVARQVLAWLQA